MNKPKRSLLLLHIVILLSSCGGNIVIQEDTGNVVQTSSEAIEQTKLYYHELINIQPEYGSIIIAADIKCDAMDPLYIWMPDPKREGYCPTEKERLAYHPSRAQGKSVPATPPPFQETNLIVVTWKDVEPYFNIISGYRAYIQGLAKFAKNPEKPSDFGLDNLEKIYKAADSSYKTVSEWPKAKDNKTTTDAFKDLYEYFKKLYDNKENADNIKALIVNDGEKMEKALETLKTNIAGWDKTYFSQIQKNIISLNAQAYSNNKHQLTFPERKELAKIILMKLLVERGGNSGEIAIGEKTSELLTKDIAAHKALRVLVVDEKMSKDQKQRAIDYTLKTWGEGITKTAAAIAELILIILKIFA